MSLGYSFSKGQPAKVGWSLKRNSVIGGQANHLWNTMVSKDIVRLQDENMCFADEYTEN